MTPDELVLMEQRAIRSFFYRYNGMVFDRRYKVLEMPDWIDFSTTPIKACTTTTDDGETLIAVAPDGEAWANFEPDVYEWRGGDILISDATWYEVRAVAPDLVWSPWRSWMFQINREGVTNDRQR